MKIFISCVSREFLECRRTLASDLRTVGYDVVIQEDFNQKGTSLLKKLESYIHSCDNVLILIGDLLGSQPRDIDDRAWSFTQWEFYFSQGYRLGKGYCEPAKPTYIYFSSPEFSIGKKFIQTPDVTVLQEKHKQNILNKGLDYSVFSSTDELCRLVLRDGFNIIDRKKFENERIAYLRNLNNELGRIKLNSLQLLSDEKANTQYSSYTNMRDIFTQPRLLRVVSFGATLFDYELGDIERDIVSIVESINTPLVVLGSPGAGKTISTHWLIQSLVEKNLTGKSTLIPIYLTADDFNHEPIETVNQVIERGVKKWSEVIDVEPTLECIMKERQNLIFILDGLDEYPTVIKRSNGEKYKIGQLLESLRKSSETYPFQKMVVTCRAQDYQYDTRLHLEGSEKVLLLQLSAQKVHEVIAAWQSFLVKIGKLNKSQSSKNVKNMIAALGSSGELASFVTNPRCLELFQLVSSVDHVTSSVPGIIQKALDVLLFGNIPSEENNRLVASQYFGFGLDEWKERTLNSLALVAKACVDRDQGTGSVTFSFIELQNAVAESFEANTPGKYKERGEALHGTLQHLVQGHGVLISMNDEAFLFAQNVLRDTLACHFLSKLPLLERLKLSGFPSWVRVFKYYGELLARENEGRFESLELAVKILHEFEKTNNYVYLWVSGELFASQVRRYEIYDGPSIFENKYQKIRKIVGNFINNPTASENERLVIGELLGRLGDHRIPTENFNEQVESSFYVEVPSKKYDLGGRVVELSGHPKYDSVQSKMVAKVEMSNFLLGKNLVTNLEFGKFIFSGGYSDSSLWDDGLAVGWARQDPGVIDFLVESIQESAEMHLHTNMVLGRLTEEEAEQSLLVMIKRQNPLFWYDQRFNRPNQPVVGINLWEAQAYARWCNKGHIFSDLCQTHKFVIPNEHEWEAAAQHYYSSINCTDTCYWNKLTAFGPQTAAVGLFPIAMHIRNGPFDMIGNVWEWTTSSNKLFGDISSIDNTGDQMRDHIVRGGSWLSSKPHTNDYCFRSYDPPSNCYEDLGFRLAAHPRAFE